MSEKSSVTPEALNDLSARVVRRYIQGVVTVEEFVERLKQAWQTNFPGEVLEGSALELLARGLCGQILCEACHLAGGQLRDLAFARLGEYLERVLGAVRGPGRCATSEMREEVIQKTLVEILRSQAREGGKPVQPMAFLSWVRVILHRQLICYWRQGPQMDLCSLEAQGEEFGAELPDEHEPDPLDEMLRMELREELLAAIASLRNPRYREVLVQTYFSGLEDLEMAVRFQVPVKDIYLWRFRALQLLRKQADVLLGPQVIKKYA